MSTLALKIRQLLEEHQYNEPGTFRYVYNRPNASFDPARDVVYYSGPVWDHDEAMAAIEAFVFGRWLPSGEKVAAFERAFSRRFGFRESLMVNSGSSANLVMMAALKKCRRWNDGDEVITSVVGFPTTLAPILQNQLRPRFADIDMTDLNFDLEAVERCIGPRTRAVVLSPPLGNPPNMDHLTDLCRRRDLALVLDGCDSLGSKWRGEHLSQFAEVTSCSFYPAHHISTGEGGMVSAFDDELVTTARSVSWWGRDCYCVGAANLLPNGTCKRRFSRWLEDCDSVVDHKYVFTNVGYNLKPLDLQGAIGLEQLKKFDSIHERRRQNKMRIQGLFQQLVPGVRVIDELPQAEAGWFGVPIVCDSGEQKEALVAHLEAQRVQTRNFFAGNILTHPAYSHLDDAARFPEANQVLSRVFFVGCHPSYSESTIDYLASVLGSFRRTVGKKLAVVASQASVAKGDPAREESAWSGAATD